MSVNLTGLAISATALCFLYRIGSQPILLEPGTRSRIDPNHQKRQHFLRFTLPLYFCLASFIFFFTLFIESIPLAGRSELLMMEVIIAILTFIFLFWTIWKSCHDILASLFVFFFVAIPILIFAPLIWRGTKLLLHLLLESIFSHPLNLQFPTALLSGLTLSFLFTQWLHDRFYKPSFLSPLNHQPMQKINSALLYSYLTKPERVAWNLGTVNFEGWQEMNCSEIENLHIRAYLQNRIENQCCPHCQELTMIRDPDKITFASSIHSKGKRLVIYRCRCCDYSQAIQKSVPKLPKRSLRIGLSSSSGYSGTGYSGGASVGSGGSSGGGGGSFGGGSSGGGGAGGSF